MIKTLNSLCVLVLMMCLMACQSREAKKNADVLRVDTEVVSRQKGALATSYVGVVEENTAVAVSFTGMGTIRQVHVAEGQRVSRGTLVAEMDKTQAQNALATAEAMHRQATDAYNRMKQLHENKSLADMKWVEVQSKVEQAEASLSAAKKMLEDCNIYVPISGVVGKKWLNAGETALPSQPVVTLIDISKLKVKVSIPEKEIAQILPSTESVIAIEALGGKTVQGGAIEKGVVADAMTHTYDIRINILNPEGNILPGMVAKVQMARGEAQDGIFLPIRAIQQGADGKHFVWTVQEGKAHRCNIVPGTTSVGNRIQVLSGIEEGQSVIVNGYQKVSEGTRVDERKRKTEN